MPEIAEIASEPSEPETTQIHSETTTSTSTTTNENSENVNENSDQTLKRKPINFRTEILK